MLGGKIVDNFMDKLAEKISASDIIRANSQAETAEAARIKQEAEQYKIQLEELKKSAQEYKAKAGENFDNLVKRMDESDEKTHDVGVQVYRNVQAVVQKSSEKTNEEFKELNRKAETIQVSVETKNRAVLPVLIITMLIAGADLVLNILIILGVL